METQETSTKVRLRKVPAFTPEQITDHAGKFTPDQLDILFGHANGWSYAELVERLGLKLGTVKSRLNRARLKLMPLLKHPNGAPMYAPDGTMLNEDGIRSIFDDVDE